MNLEQQSHYPDFESIGALCSPELLPSLKKIVVDANKKLNFNTLDHLWQAYAQTDFLSNAGSSLSIQESKVQICGREKCSVEELNALEQALQSLKPWRKGPFSFHGIDLDAEWDSALKWQRLKAYLGPLWGKKVLDVGCNNGYYLLKMCDGDPDYALGIDPTARFYLQWKLLTRGLHLPMADFQLLGIEHLNHFPKVFDTVLCLGILYHHPDPIGQLKLLHQAMNKSGRLIIEVMGIDSEDEICLFPQKRYAKAPGVWFLPSARCLENWLQRAGFTEIEHIHSGKTRVDEQRNTKYCPRPFETLTDFLDPEDEEKTVEGYPAPYRHMYVAWKKND
ncbi:MAG: tRNA 5-methoxyuridine(34)/uridine 5-oxyacetic acid(34) synthase CmoB [Planctomycetes bacterium]|nr:tRNA 5-methoxyuridine(34)/uridine 5-oxyacetic acid(34) synthase CmoB [Planctomycetota bacterium]